jgi:hypothetical protein
MVVELMHFSGNLGNFLEAEVVRMGLAKREYHVYKVFTDLGNPRDAFARSGNAHHRLGRMQADFIPDLAEFGQQMPEQPQRVLGLALQEMGEVGFVGGVGEGNRKYRLKGRVAAIQFYRNKPLVENRPGKKSYCIFYKKISFVFLR